MSFNPRFHQGANKRSIADAMNPFFHLQPIIAGNSKDEQHCAISISRQVIKADERDEHRPQHQDESDSVSQIYEWPIPSQS